MDSDTLLARVAARYAGGSWPDPHAERDVAEEEYSRTSDPERYRIVAARAIAWTEVLRDAGLATGDVPEDLDVLWRDGFPDATPPSRCWVLRPVRSGAVPLVFSLRGFEGPDDNVLTIGAGEPAVPVVTVPQCGCDACDDGSARLLEELDERVLDVVSGAYVHLSTATGVVQGFGNGWSAEGDRGSAATEHLLAEARAGRAQDPVVHGVAW